MKQIFTRIACLLALLLTATAYAQETCPDNIDFERGDLSVWEFYTGTCCPSGAISATTLSGVVTGRHTLTSGTGTDAYGGFPIVAPGGGSYSFKLGNASSGNQAEKARYYVHIPSGISDYALIYRFAVVLQDPASHTTAQKPRFEVTATDSATGNDVPCAQYEYVASGSIPGFTRSSRGSDVYYKSWSTASINLSGMGGRTVIIDFASGDCDLGAHFGYGYVDMNCGLFAIANYTCDTSDIRLGAPDGFQAYEWYDSSNMSTLLDTGQYITAHSGSIHTYAVVLTPYTGYGCPDTLYTRVEPSQLRVDPLRDTSLCFANGLTVTANASDVYFPLTYSWTSTAAITCPTCQTTFVDPSDTSDIIVTVTNPMGCTVSDTMKVTGKFLRAAFSSLDESCYGYANGRSTATLLTSEPLSYYWFTSPVQTTATAYNLAPGVYTVRITDTAGCSGYFSDTINAAVPRYIYFTDSTDPTTCSGSDGTISIGGLIPSSVDTVLYKSNGTWVTAYVTASSSGGIRITGLPRGVYDSFRIVTALCPYNTLRTITLSDPPLPGMPFPSSNSPLCQFDTLKLVNYSTGAGITYNWSGPAGFSSTLQNPTRIVSAMADSGYYHISVTRANCTVSDSVYLSLSPAPVPVPTSNAPICQGDSLKLNVYSAIGADRFVWSGPNSYGAVGAHPAIAGADTLATGVYTVTATLNGCRATTTMFADVHGIPTPPVVNDVTYCQFATASPLSAVGLNLRWFPDPVSGTGSVTAPTPGTTTTGVTTWNVNQTSPWGCVSDYSKVKATIVEFPALSMYVSDTNICQGATVAMNARTSGENYTYINWYISDGDSVSNATQVVHGFRTVGIFTVTATTNYQYCPSQSTSHIVRVYPNPSLNIGSDTSVCLGGSPVMLADVINAGNSAASWLWNTGATTSSISVATEGLYYVTVRIDGCTASDSILLSDGCYLNIPNVFTPNGDGVNDTYLPRPLMARGLTSFKMEIYDRWGQKVFTTSNVEGEGWDGRFNDKPQPSGVYIYKIEASFIDGERFEKHGNLTLLR